MTLTRSLFAALTAAAALALTAPAARAVDESDLLPIDQAFALTAEPAGPDRVRLHWAIADGYYLYRHRMGADSQTASFVIDRLELPPGKRYVDEFFGEVETYREQVEATVLGVAGEPGAVDLRIRYQGCADLGVCYPPHTQTVRVALPATDAGRTGASAPAPGAAGPGFNPLAPAGTPLIGAAPAGAVEELPLPAEQAFAFEAIAVDHDALLLRFTPAPGYYLYRERNTFTLAGDPPAALGEPQWPAASAHHDDHFGDVAVYFEQVEVPMAVRRLTAGPVELQLQATFQGCQNDGICYPPMTRDVRLALPALPAGELPASAVGDAPAPAGLAAGALLTALVGALLGGLILNLMPCVLPVLSLKALSLADSGHSHRQARHSALWYTAGVLVSFAALGLAAIGLREAGAALGWGFQLQQPWVVALLAYVMFAVGLSLSGLFQIGAGLAGIGQSLTEKRGASGDFFTGVLAVVVASPCTAPFMGPALAFAFAAPAWWALVVFVALGLGLALPFLLIGFVPALASRLPRPGAWMVAFKQVMAFPMYLTAVWLAWVLAKQRGADAIGLLLAGAVLLAAALWGFERQRWKPRLFGVAFTALAAVAALAAIPAIQRLPAARATAAESDASVPYSAERLASLRRDDRVVFVNMTADWCVTCKANEARVLSTAAFGDAISAADAVYMKGDWTNVDPEITRFLEQHGAVGVPLYVVFAPGRPAGEVLPTVLSIDAVTAAVQRAEASR